MRIGVPREIKNHEYRVGLTPASVEELTRRGHEVLVQADAGAAIGLADEQYRAAGAQVVPEAGEVFARGELIVKVKEPQAGEVRMLWPGQVLFTYLHLACDAALTRALVDSGAVCIAYETVTGPGGGLPLLAPMSEVAGRMAVQAGAHHLEIARGGRGILLGGVPGVLPGHVVVLGAGVVGSNAVQMSVGLGARVTVLDRSVERLRQLDLAFGNRIQTACADARSIHDAVVEADLVIGAVLVPGAKAPKLVTRRQVSQMRPGAVVVDVAIDQGGCFETSRPTTHEEPTHEVDGVVHYGVTNMPGAVARTSTFALNHATIAHALTLADKGWQAAMRDDPHLKAGLNVCQGQVTCEAVARGLGYAWVDPTTLLEAR